MEERKLYPVFVCEIPESASWHTSRIVAVYVVQQVKDKTRQDKCSVISVGKSGSTLHPIKDQILILLTAEQRDFRKDF